MAVSCSTRPIALAFTGSIYSGHFSACVGVEGSLLIGTRLSSAVQAHNASCTDAYRCAKWVPEPSTTAYYAAQHTDFVGDIESSTIRFQHKGREYEAFFREILPTGLDWYAVAFVVESKKPASTISSSST